MDCKAKIITPQYDGTATVKLENNQLIFLNKPAWVGSVFGIIGKALASEEEMFRLDIADIVSANLSVSRNGKPVYTLFFNVDKRKYELTFRENNQLTEMFEKLLGEKLEKAQ